MGQLSWCMQISISRAGSPNALRSSEAHLPRIHWSPVRNATPHGATALQRAQRRGQHLPEAIKHEGPDSKMGKAFTS